MKMLSAPVKFGTSRRVRELERLLGRKTMEVEILREALNAARVKKPLLQLQSLKDRKDGSQ